MTGDALLSRMDLNKGLVGALQPGSAKQFLKVHITYRKAQAFGLATACSLRHFVVFRSSWIRV